MIEPDKLDKCKQEISDWIKHKAKAASATTLLVHVTGGIDSAYAAWACANTGMDTVLVYTYVDSSGFPGDRVRKYSTWLGCRLVMVNLTPTIRSISGQYHIHAEASDRERKRTLKALAACAKTPALDYIAKCNNALIVGCHNRDEDFFMRSFHRRGSGTADIQPLGDLHKSEIYQLAESAMLPPEFLRADSTTDQYGGDETDPPDRDDELFITSKDVEWARIECEKWAKSHDCTFEDYVKSTWNSFFDGGEDFPEYFDDRQRKVMLVLIEKEKNTRYKSQLNVPRYEIPTLFRKEIDNDA